MMGTLRQLAHRGALAKWAACPLLLLEFAFLPLAAQAASIEVLADETSDHPALIRIKGKFLKARFSRTSRRLQGLRQSKGSRP
jgi:hypothetical protein